VTVALNNRGITDNAGMKEFSNSERLKEYYDQWLNQIDYVVVFTISYN